MGLISWWQNIPATLNPIAFSFGFFSVYWYAVFFLGGFLVTLLFALKLVNRGDTSCSEECVWDMFIYIFIGAFLGGRIGYALFYNFNVFWAEPLKIFLPYDFERGMWVGISGMSYYGGLIGTVLALYWFARAKDLNFWKIADFAAFLAPISVFFGRLGNFFNLELYGRITEKPWGMIFPQVVPMGVLRHPSSLYEAFLEGVVIFIVLLFLRKKMPFAGALTCIYLALYAILRFLVEFWREPDPQLGLFFNSPIGGFTLNQILAFGLFWAAIGIFMWLRRQNYATMGSRKKMGLKY
jgi:phosphatidylglycerol---prolipoprotein diacylglyceryl transferase